MNRIFSVLIISIMFLSVNLHAQLPGDYKLLTVTGGSTMTGNDTSYLSGYIDGVGNVAIQANYVKSSGTVETGSMRLFTSNDGIIYSPYPSDREMVWTDSLNITRALSSDNLDATTASMTWTLPVNIARYYKIRVWTAYTTGTVPVGVISGSTIIRKLNGIR